MTQVRHHFTSDRLTDKREHAATIQDGEPREIEEPTMPEENKSLQQFIKLLFTNLE